MVRSAPVRQRLLQFAMNCGQLAEQDARGEEVERREQQHAALIAAIVCNIWPERTRLGPSVRQQPPRFSTITETEGCGMTFGLGQRTFRDFCVHCGFHAGL